MFALRANMTKQIKKLFVRFYIQSNSVDNEPHFFDENVSRIFNRFYYLYLIVYQIIWTGVVGPSAYR